MITKEDIKNILQDPFSKKVLSFKGMELDDLRDYVSWAEKRLLKSNNKQIDDALLELSPFMGNTNSNINYYQLMEKLNSMCLALKINPPRQLDAIRLFLLGEFEEICLKLKMENVDQNEILLSSIYEIELIISSCKEKFEKILIIRDRFCYLDNFYPTDSLESIAEDLYRYIIAYISNSHVEIFMEDNLYNIQVETSNQI